MAETESRAARWGQWQRSEGGEREGGVGGQSAEGVGVDEALRAVRWGAEGAVGADIGSL